MVTHSSILLPGESHGWRSLVGYSPRGCKESDTTYDFNNPALYPTTEYASPLEIPARPERTKAVPRTAAAAKPKYAVAPFAVLGMLVAARIFIAGIMAQIQLVDVTNSAVELNSEIE